MQDLIGIRIVTYFADDVQLVKQLLSKRFRFLAQQIDTPNLTEFKPKRTNIICSIPEQNHSIFQDVLKSTDSPHLKLLDETFELQLRTVLSEGWHEIDHSLRYKCKEDWTNHPENERLLNGIYASLETNDIALKSLFEELAYKHFKNKNWEGLIRTKFRLKFGTETITNSLKTVLNSDEGIGKQIVRLDRSQFLLQMAELDLSLPINLSNLIYMANATVLKNQRIFEVTPQFFLNSIKQ